MGISVTQLLIVFAIVIIVFGTKRLHNLGSDLGGAIKSFRAAIKEGENEKKAAEEKENIIDGEVISKKDEES
ncbi:Sec-independent protein translocase subunit TatA [Methylobacter sp. YRD-M1]|uniref:Sec-independent protein translocase subunit TatA n=1 Tax=Methylobacter sp. YRD-M1 TaxID=2911520 RepID=UPI00227C5483|nr:Sec-independent protein translocase subunit TatA [Methylobacter sp. YRD-M1]WAK02028.1 Sec-independent protein translocase subunit TatA [Methylobacter sp. YRD-M1]